MSIAHSLCQLQINYVNYKLPFQLQIFHKKSLLEQPGIEPEPQQSEATD